jgi:hypothetical protein
VKKVKWAFVLYYTGWITLGLLMGVGFLELFALSAWVLVRI